MRLLNAMGLRHELCCLCLLISLADSLWAAFKVNAWHAMQALVMPFCDIAA